MRPLILMNLTMTGFAQRQDVTELLSTESRVRPMMELKSWVVTHETLARKP